MTSQPGFSVYILDKILDHVFRDVVYTPPATIYAQQHVGPPGAAGTANVSAVATRHAVTFAAAAGAIITLTTTYPVWTETATETETWISLWDASTSGNLIALGTLTSPQSEQNGYTFTLNVCTIDLTALLAS